METLQGEKINSSDISELAKMQETDRDRLINTAIHKPLIQLIDEFIIEMNAKNRAYYFILEFGYLDAFRDYCHRK